MNKILKTGVLLLVLGGTGYALYGAIQPSIVEKTSQKKVTATDHSKMDKMVTYVKPKVYAGTKSAITSYLGEIQTEKNGQIYPYRAGIVEAYLANVGDTVQKGQVVARLLPAEYSPDIANMIADRKAERTRSEGMVKSAELTLAQAQSRKEKIFESANLKISSSEKVFQDAKKRGGDIDSASNQKIISSQKALESTKTIQSRTEQSTALQLQKTISEQDAKITKLGSDLALADIRIWSQEKTIANIQKKTDASVALESDKLGLRETTVKTAIKNAHARLLQVFYGASSSLSNSSALKNTYFGAKNTSLLPGFATSMASLHMKYQNIDTLGRDDSFVFAREVADTVDKGIKVLDATITSSDYDETMLNTDKTMLIEAKTDSMYGILTVLNMYEEQKGMLTKETTASASEYSNETIMLERLKAERDVAQKELAVAKAEKDRMIAEVSNMKSSSENDTTRMVSEAQKMLATETADKIMSLSEADKMVTEADKMLATENADKIMSLSEADKMITEGEKMLIDARSTYQAATEALSVLESAGFSNEVRAPFAGKITRRNINAGESIAMNTPLYDIVGSDVKKETPKMFVRFEIPETDLFDAILGKEVRFYRTAEPLRKLTAKIARVSPAVGSATKGIVIEAELAENTKDLPIGSSLRVEMEKTGNMLLIPSSSVVQSDDGKLSVFTIDSKGIIRSKPVSTERTVGLDVYISSGITKDDKIIELPKNYAFLEDGVKVEPMEKPTVATPAGGAPAMPEGHKH